MALFSQGCDKITIKKPDTGQATPSAMTEVLTDESRVKVEIV